MTMRDWEGYVSVDWEVDGDNIEPLLYCLSFAIQLNRPLDYFLPGILTGEGTSGGDPGWVMYPERRSDGRTVYVAWTNPDMSDLDPCEGEYDEATVKLHVRRTLNNFAHAHPESTAEVDRLVAKYGL
jgi:hypothetical protein